MKGTFIAFEGIDHSGKSTQSRLLSNFLAENGYQLLKTREPGGTDISEEIRKILLDLKNLKMTAKTELLLYQASRSQLVTEKIIPALENGKVVIADRYIFSTLAYQGGGRGIAKEEVKNLCLFATSNLLPDFTFFVDINFETYVQRKNFSKGKLDRIESESLDFFRRVSETYRNLVNEFENFYVINGNREISEIQQEIREILGKSLKF